jgi:hypothetical protein
MRFSTYLQIVVNDDVQKSSMGSKENGKFSHAFCLCD